MEDQFPLYHFSMLAMFWWNCSPYSTLVCQKLSRKNFKWKSKMWMLNDILHLKSWNEFKICWRFFALSDKTNFLLTHDWKQPKSAMLYFHESRYFINIVSSVVFTKFFTKPNLMSKGRMIILFGSIYIHGDFALLFMHIYESPPKGPPRRQYKLRHFFGNRIHWNC